MRMLESADKLYEEGEAVPLNKIIRDLGLEENKL